MAIMSPTVNSSHITQLLKARFRCADDLAEFHVSDGLSKNSGYFRLGLESVCFGQCAGGLPADHVDGTLYDANESIRAADSSIQLPFDPAEIVDNLRFERYASTANRPARTITGAGLLRNLYYALRPLMPVPIRRPFQKLYFRGWKKIRFPKWPVDLTVENIFEQLLAASMKSQGLQRVPFIWFWPEGAPSCTIITHDVETQAGVDFCPQLMDLNDSFATKTSFQIVPEQRYPVTSAYLENIHKRGFEVAVQDLNHDGLLYSSREEFLRRVQKINAYRKQYGADGFRAAVLYRNVEWYDALDFDYDMSIPNVAHLDPQRGGCCTVFPYFIGRLIELPVTASQDYTLFHMLNDYSMALWEEQIAAILQRNGLISFIVHPDYIIEPAARRIYTELLQRLHALRASGQTWIALPREVAAWWRVRSELNLVRDGASWRIEGQGRERARVAYAVLENDKLKYEL